MSNNSIFKALSSPTRIKILQTLVNRELHLTALSKEIGISVPVTSRHIKTLENAGLINKRIIGNVHLLRIKTNNLEKLLQPYIDETELDLEKEQKLFDALKQIPGIKVKKIRNHQYIQSIDNEKGYYIYEVDGKLPDKPIDEYIVNKNINLDIKKIVTIKKKNIKINIKNSKGKE